MTAKPIPTEPVVPEGKDAVDNLTIGELDFVSRKLGVSVDTAITKDVDGLKWRGLAMVGWVWHRRLDRAAELESWLNIGIDELIASLRMDADDDELPDDVAHPGSEHVLTMAGACSATGCEATFDAEAGAWSIPAEDDEEDPMASGRVSS